MPLVEPSYEASLKAYQDRIKELEEALKPFAALEPVTHMNQAGKVLHSWSIHYANEFELRASDIRRAAELLRK